MGTTPSLLTVEEAAEQARLGRTTMYQLVKTGQVRSVKIGRSRRVPRDAVDSYVAKLLAAQMPPDAA